MEIELDINKVKEKTLNIYMKEQNNSRIKLTEAIIMETINSLMKNKKKEDIGKDLKISINKLNKISKILGREMVKEAIDQKLDMNDDNYARIEKSILQMFEKKIENQMKLIEFETEYDVTNEKEKKQKLNRIKKNGFKLGKNTFVFKEEYNNFILFVSKENPNRKETVLKITRIKK